MTQVAIITGSDSGIGKATAVRLAHDGFDIGVTWHSDQDGAEGTAEEVRRAGGRAEVAQLDVTALPDAADTLDELADRLGGLDVLVNNAGTGGSTPFLELELQRWRDVLEVDLTGAFVCAQRAARRMVKSQTAGRIVNVTSVHEHVPLPGASAYCAQKAAWGCSRR